MAQQITPSQQKLAEKLTILNDRGVGMLTRIYNIKKVSNNTLPSRDGTENTASAISASGRIRASIIISGVIMLILHVLTET